MSFVFPTFTRFPPSQGQFSRHTQFTHVEIELFLCEHTMAVVADESNTICTTRMSGVDETMANEENCHANGKREMARERESRVESEIWYFGSGKKSSKMDDNKHKLNENQIWSVYIRSAFPFILFSFSVGSNCQLREFVCACVFVSVVFGWRRCCRRRRLSFCFILYLFCRFYRLWARPDHVCYAGASGSFDKPFWRHRHGLRHPLGVYASTCHLHSTALPRCVPLIGALPSSSA